jgi:hypothetical protein
MPTKATGLPDYVTEAIKKNAKAELPSYVTEALKKKESGTKDSKIGTSPTSPSVSPSTLPSQEVVNPNADLINKLTGAEFLQPSTAYNNTVVTKDGVVLKANIGLPVPNEVKKQMVSDIQQRVFNNTETDEDVAVLSNDGLEPDDIRNYVASKDLGDQNRLVKAIKFRGLNPDEIINDERKIAKFYKDENEAVLNPTMNVPLNPYLRDGNIDIRDNAIVDLVYNKPNLSREQKIAEIAMLTNPKLYKKYEQSIQSVVERNVQSRTNPLSVVSGLWEGSDEKILQSGKTGLFKAELKLNERGVNKVNQLKQQFEKETDPEIKKQLAIDIQKESTNITSFGDMVEKYPYQAATMYNSVANDFKRGTSMNVKGQDEETVYNATPEDYESAASILKQIGVSPMQIQRSVVGVETDLYLAAIAMNKAGYFKDGVDAKVKNGAIDYLRKVAKGEIELKDYSVANGLGESIATPFVSAAKGLADIIGARSEAQMFYEKQREQDFSNQVNDDELKTGVSVARNIVNTTGNVAGQAALMYVTGGLARGIDLSKLAATESGFWVSGGLPAYDDAYKESMDFIDNKNGRVFYSMFNAGVTAAAERIFPETKILDIPNMSSVNELLVKHIREKTLTKEIYDQLVNQSKSNLERFATSSGKFGASFTTNTAKEVVEEAFTSGMNSVSQMVAGNEDMTFDQALANMKSVAIQTATGMPIVAGFAARSDMNNIRRNANNNEKVLWYSSNYKDDAEAAIQEGYEKGAYDEKERNTKLAIVNRAFEHRVGLENDLTLNNTSLPEELKIKFVANKTAQSLVEKQIENTTNEFYKKQAEEKLARLKQQEVEILNQSTSNSPVEQEVIAGEPEVITQPIELEVTPAATPAPATQEVSDEDIYNAIDNLTDEELDEYETANAAGTGDEYLRSKVQTSAPVVQEQPATVQLSEDDLFVKELVDEELIPNVDRLSLTTEGVFDQSKIPTYLQFVSDQTNDVGEQSMLNKGYPKQLLDLAKETVSPKTKKINEPKSRTRNPKPAATPSVEQNAASQEQGAATTQAAAQGAVAENITGRPEAAAPVQLEAAEKRKAEKVADLNKTISPNATTPRLASERKKALDQIQKEYDAEIAAIKEKQQSAPVVAEAAPVAPVAPVEAAPVVAPQQKATPAKAPVAPPVVAESAAAPVITPERPSAPRVIPTAPEDVTTRNISGPVVIEAKAKPAVGDKIMWRDSQYTVESINKDGSFNARRGQVYVRGGVVGDQQYVGVIRQGEQSEMEDQENPEEVEAIYQAQQIISEYATEKEQAQLEKELGKDAPKIFLNWIEGLQQVSEAVHKIFSKINDQLTKLALVAGLVFGLGAMDATAATTNDSLKGKQAVVKRIVENPVRQRLVEKYGQIIADRWTDYRLADIRLSDGKTYREIFNEIAAEFDLPVEILFASTNEEGFRQFVKNPTSTIDKGFSVNGFQDFGLDNFAEMFSRLAAQGYLPTSFSSRFKENKQTNELGQEVRSANFKTAIDAIRAKAAVLTYMNDKVVEYADKNNIALSDKALDFFMVVGYNAGLGNAQKMLKEYSDVGALENDAFLQQRPTVGNAKVQLKESSWLEPYTHAMRRMIPAQAWADEGIFSVAAEAGIKERGKDLADKIRQGQIILGGGLQSNILGIPIGIYNTAVKAVARLIEDGASLIQAIDNVIKQYKLNDYKGFDKDVFSALVERDDDVSNVVSKSAPAPTVLTPEQKRVMISVEVRRKKGMSDEDIKTDLIKRGKAESVVDLAINFDKPKQPEAIIDTRMSASNLNAQETFLASLGDVVIDTNNFGLSGLAFVTSDMNEDAVEAIQNTEGEMQLPDAQLTTYLSGKTIEKTINFLDDFSLLKENDQVVAAMSLDDKANMLDVLIMKAKSAFGEADYVERLIKMVSDGSINESIRIDISVAVDRHLQALEGNPNTYYRAKWLREQNAAASQPVRRTVSLALNTLRLWDMAKYQSGALGMVLSQDMRNQLEETKIAMAMDLTDEQLAESEDGEVEDVDYDETEPNKSAVQKTKDFLFGSSGFAKAKRDSKKDKREINTIAKAYDFIKRLEERVKKCSK